MNYQSDILLGLQNFNEGKTTYMINLFKNNFYDLCIKVNGGLEKSSVNFNNRVLILKEIPYSILYGIDTYISDDCIINFDNLKEDISLLNSLKISLKKLFISNAAILVTNKYNNEDNEYDMYKNALTRKINNNAIRICDLTNKEFFLFFLNNSIKRVYTIDFLKNYKKILLYQHLSFNNDINSQYNYRSCFYCSSSFCTNIINYKSISNIYGICCPYEIHREDFNHTKDLDKVKEMENNDNIFINWLNLDKLIENININNIKILIITKSEYLINLNILKLIYDGNICDFSNIDIFKSFIREKINKNCNISYIKFIHNF